MDIKILSVGLYFFYYLTKNKPEIFKDIHHLGKIAEDIKEYYENKF